MPTVGFKVLYEKAPKKAGRCPYIVVVKKMFRYSNVFFYNHLCRNSVFRNIIMENGKNIDGDVSMGISLEAVSKPHLPAK
jgi:hypothetical protein